MDTLPHRHLTTLALDVDFAGVVAVGVTPAGGRGIVPVRGGRFAGERLSGTVAPGHDWFLTRANGTLLIDVRLTLTTDDGATIYLAYTGGMYAASEVFAQFRRGEPLAPGSYALRIVARLECGDDRYRWLNDMLVVGVGEQTLAGPVYHLFAIG
jgi:Protein of unknown function (DUF3237)